MPEPTARELLTRLEKVLKRTRNNTRRLEGSVVEYEHLMSRARARDYRLGREPYIVPLE